jgi:hypothetical protein
MAAQPQGYLGSLRIPPFRISFHRSSLFFPLPLRRSEELFRKGIGPCIRSAPWWWGCGSCWVLTHSSSCVMSILHFTTTTNVLRRWSWLIQGFRRQVEPILTSWLLFLGVVPDSFKASDGCGPCWRYDCFPICFKGLGSAWLMQAPIHSYWFYTCFMIAIRGVVPDSFTGCGFEVDSDFIYKDAISFVTYQYMIITSVYCASARNPNPFFCYFSPFIS